MFNFWCNLQIIHGHKQLHICKHPANEPPELLVTTRYFNSLQICNVCKLYMLLNYRIRPFTKYVTSMKYKFVMLFLNEAIEWTIYSKVIIIRESVPLINKAWTILIAFMQVALLQLVKWFCFSTQSCIFAGSLEAAYSLNWGARDIWGKGGGETLALLW